MYLSVYLSIYLSTYLSIYLSSILSNEVRKGFFDTDLEWDVLLGERERISGSNSGSKQW